MEQRLTEAQLAQVVAEVTRLSHEREDFKQKTLDRSQVLQVLNELELPPDLLDDALLQLRRKEELERQKQRNKWILVVAIIFSLGLVSMIALGGLSGFLFYKQQGAAISAVTSGQGRITLSVDNGEDLSSVNREAGEVRYHVKLQNAPIGSELDMSCRWYNPSGQLEHENRWRTKTIDKSVWPTECKCKIGPASPAGDWRVEMLLGGKILSSRTFRVE